MTRRTAGGIARVRDSTTTWPLMRTSHGAPHMVENSRAYSAIALYHCIELKPIVRMVTSATMPTKIRASISPAMMARPTISRL